MKPVEFLGDSLDAIKAFPTSVRRRAGYQIDRLQNGLEPNDWKPMTTVGSGVREIRIRDSSGAFRVVYVAHLAEAIYVLHAFQKKTHKTARRDIDRAAWSLQTLVRARA